MWRLQVLFLINGFLIKKSVYTNIITYIPPTSKKVTVASADMGLAQIVRKPTRGQNLLDLVLTDIDGGTATQSGLNLH